MRLSVVLFIFWDIVLRVGWRRVICPALLFLSLPRTLPGADAALRVCFRGPISFLLCSCFGRRALANALYIVLRRRKRKGNVASGAVLRASFHLSCCVLGRPVLRLALVDATFICSFPVIFAASPSATCLFFFLFFPRRPDSHTDAPLLPSNVLRKRFRSHSIVSTFSQNQRYLSVMNYCVTTEGLCPRSPLASDRWIEGAHVR